MPDSVSAFTKSTHSATKKDASSLPNARSLTTMLSTRAAADRDTVFVSVSIIAKQPVSA